MTAQHEAEMAALMDEQEEVSKALTQRVAEVRQVRPPPA
jgi:hypothetical protein